MSEHRDLRAYKQNLREIYIKRRLELLPEKKAQMDHDIFQRVCSLREYKLSDTVLCYVSMAVEVDTLQIIRCALNEGKRVAAPYCYPNTHKMGFYFISSLNELKPGTFSVLEPDPLRQRKLVDLDHGICLIPALTVDRNGYRLGYGKGYYDRFLPEYKGYKVGLCYANFLRDHLAHGKYDQPLECLVTDRMVLRFRRHPTAENDKK